MGTRFGRIAWALTVLVACALALAVPSEALAETVSADVRFFQEYKVDASGLPNAFDYRITAVDDAAPLPINEAGETAGSFTLRRDQDMNLTFTFEDASLAGADMAVYRYKAEPVEPRLTDGLYYVDISSESLTPGVNVYYIEVYVYAAGDGTIERVIPTVHVEGWDGPKWTDPGWRIAWDERTPEDPTPENPTPEQPASEKPTRYGVIGATLSLRGVTVPGGIRLYDFVPGPGTQTTSSGVRGDGTTTAAPSSDGGTAAGAPGATGAPAAQPDAAVATATQSAPAAAAAPAAPGEAAATPAATISGSPESAAALATTGDATSFRAACAVALAGLALAACGLVRNGRGAR